jgi:hypothetical protein
MVATELFLLPDQATVAVAVVHRQAQRLELVAQVQLLLAVAVAVVDQETGLTPALAVMAAMASAVFMSGKVKI